MKKAILASLFFFYVGEAHAQDNPYAIFGYKVKTILKDEPNELLNVPNKNLKSEIKSFTFDPIKKCVWLKDAKGEIIGNVPVKPTEIKRFMSVDRFSDKYYDLSPYQYAANNPLRYIDYNGDSLVVSAGGNSYNYGFTKTGGYGFYDKAGSIYAGNDKYINAVSGALGRLGLGKEGRTLIDFLSSVSSNIEILSTTKSNSANFSGTKKSISWDANNTNGGPDQSGSTVRPTFIGLGHEMAHVEDAINGTYKQGDWVNDPNVSLTIPNAEIYSTHRENQFRAEQGLPLRTDYSPNYSGSRLIDATTRSSLYFNSQGGSYFNPANNTYNRVPKGTTRFGY